MLRLLKIFIPVILMSFSANAQVSVGAGLGIASPFIYNKYVTGYSHSQVSPAVNLRLLYKPANSTFSPSLNIAASQYVLPVTRIDASRVLNMHFTSVNTMLQISVQKQIGNNELYYGIGVGANYITGSNVDISGDKNLVREVKIDSSEYIKQLLPQAGIHTEIVLPISREKPLYAGIGLQMAYSYLFDQQTAYRVHIVDNNYTSYKLNPRLGGHMMTVYAYVALYYRFGTKR